MHFEITIATTDERFQCPAGQTLLAAMERLGRTDIPVGCRNGGCGVCKVRVVHGAYVTTKMNKAVLSDEDRAMGCTLACKTYPDSSMAVEPVAKRPRSASQQAPNGFDPLFGRTRRQSNQET